MGASGAPSFDLPECQCGNVMWYNDYVHHGKVAQSVRAAAL